MKGQYLAVETVFVLGIGLMLAIGIVSIFNDIKSNVLDDAKPEQAEFISSKIELAMKSLKQSDNRTNLKSSGRIVEDLPDSLSGSDYSLSINDKSIIVEYDSKNYEREIGSFRDYSLSGSTDGGSTTIIKNQNEYRIEAR